MARDKYLDAKEELGNFMERYTSLSLYIDDASCHYAKFRTMNRVDSPCMYIQLSHSWKGLFETNRITGFRNSKLVTSALTLIGTWIRSTSPPVTYCG